MTANATVICVLIASCLSGVRDATASDCTVDNVPVQQDFDLSRYMGKWYKISGYSDIAVPTMTDYTHHYVHTSEDNATVYVQGRVSGETGPCRSALYTLTVTASPGKLEYTSDGVTIPYWVLETDYTQYAFIYGCYNVSSSGSCSGAHAWVWSRTETLPENITDRASTFYQNICIERSSFATVTFGNACEVKTHWRRANNQKCAVSTFNVQENFDITKYIGTWYEMKWLSSIVYPPNELFQDYQHHYVMTGEKNITAYAYGRSPTDNQCFHRISILNVTDTPGKMMYFPVGDRSSPYWVIKTDYTQYAVVYGCYNVSSDGSCYEARSWVWSRTPTLPNHLQYKANTVLQNICVNPTAFLDTEQKKTCKVRTQWPLGNNQNCTVSSFSVQENFDISKYAGTWYEMKWLSSIVYPPNELFQDYQHHYIMTGEGNITGYNYGRSPTDNKCFYKTSVLNVTDTPGKLMYFPVGNRPSPYWVIKTDYTQYAVVYGCYNVSSDGSCYEARSWVWSRTPTLPNHLQYEANTVLQNICVNPTAFLDTEHRNLCPPEPILPVHPDFNCNVSSFVVQRDFNMTMFTRVWYETKWLPTEYQSLPTLSTDRQEEVFVSDQGDFTSYIRYRDGGTCKYNSVIYRKTNTPGKFKASTFASKESYDLWVADTDYVTYAVLYGCESIGPDGGCVSARGLVWSRSPTLTTSLQHKANSVLQRFCVNPSALVTTQHEKACPPEEVKPCSNNQATGSSSPRSLVSYFLMTFLLLGIYLL